MMATKSLLHKTNYFFTAKVHIAPLAVFRVLYGALMLFASLRFVAKGWVSELYLKPKFFFHYFGFSWVKPPTAYGLPDWLTYAVFIAMALAALGVLLGYFYRVSALSFALLFTYTELWDITNYLNHYYFVSLLSFLMVLLPANQAFSLDARYNPLIKSTYTPRWTILVIQLQLGIVYFMAGVAKINPDWLLEAQPLRLWLAAHSEFPVLGTLFTYTWVAYAFSWFGMFYDISIPFFLSYKKTRIPAYAAVVIFHILTGLLFPIGVFPWVMIGLTLIFFPASFHKNILKVFKYRFSGTFAPVFTTKAFARAIAFVLGLFFVFQLLFPFRYLAYPGNLFWTEQGFRFSWRVMLIEKAGLAQFYIENENGQRIAVENKRFLTNRQEKMMATQPDLILQYAHYLSDQYSTVDNPQPAVYVDSFVALNGRQSRRFIPETLNLNLIKDDWKHRSWLIPFNQNQTHYAKQQ